MVCIQYVPQLCQQEGQGHNRRKLTHLKDSIPVSHLATIVALPFLLAKLWHVLYTDHGRWGMIKQIQVLLAMWVLLATQGPGLARPEGPENLKAPAGEEVILVAHATGTQIYVCQAGADQKFAWVFKAPEAELTDATGKKIAHHFAGPTWKHADGSEVKAKVAAKQDAPKVEAPKPEAPSCA